MTPLAERDESFEQRSVTYTVEVEGRVVIIEGVPARVSRETGEQFFSPATVERIHEIIHGHRAPKRHVQIPVYDFAA